MQATMNRKARREMLRQNAAAIAPVPVPAPTWQGETEEKRIFLGTGKYKNGREILRPVTIRYIILTSPHGQAIKFTVTHITKYAGRGENKHPVFRSTTITDHRDEETGILGTSGMWGTRDTSHLGKGRAKSFTPTGWVTEVTRYIGENQAWNLLTEMGYDHTTRQL